MNRDELLRQFEGMTARDVEVALSRESLDELDIVALLSQAAEPYLEDMAQLAQRKTQQRFGRTMQLYAPLYLSNECVNRCSYCGFSHELDIPRLTLSIDAVAAEAARLHEDGFRHLLLVSGEDQRAVSLDYLVAAAHILRPHFDSLSVEVGTFDLGGYRRLVDAGIDGIALYQETYQPEEYRKVHLAGPKCNFERRLRAVDIAAQAGFRSLGIAALLGLAPWQLEAFALARHGRELSLRFWRSRIAISFPRIRGNAGGRAAPHAVSDRELVQMICAMRLALPDAELVLSTREPAKLRDHLMGIGITRMSAGSRTNPGGYVGHDRAGEQFTIEDGRSASEVANALVQRGFEPVWKDFDRGFLATAAAATQEVA